MKKIKVFLLSAAIVAAGSAFIPATTDGEPYVLVNGNFIPKNPSMGECQENGTVCTYTLRPIEERVHEEPPYTEEDFSFNTSDNEKWVSF